MTGGGRAEGSGWRRAMQTIPLRLKRVLTSLNQDDAHWAAVSRFAHHPSRPSSPRPAFCLFPAGEHA